jgi:DNA-binding IclR family transcriptional regulator
MVTMAGIESDGEYRGPSREEIESLCLLHAMGERGCLTTDLAKGLGLSPALASRLVHAVTPLVQAGWVEVQDDRFSVTDAGAAWLADRLAALL